MALFYSIWLLFLARFCIAQSDESDEIDTVGLNAANEVYNEIFNVRGYNRFLSPIYTRKTNSSGGLKTAKLNIHFDLWYIKLISLDAQSQMLSICLELRTYWRDSRLAWNESQFDGVEHIFVYSDAVWLPDNQIGNAKTIDSVKPADAQRLVQIFSNGSIYYPGFYYTEVACPIMISTFPFDKQICPIPIMSLAFDVNSVALTASIDPFLTMYTKPEYINAVAREVSNNEYFAVLTKAFIEWGNGEWDVTNVSTFGTVQAGVQMVAYLLNIRRVPNFYVYVIALPCFILTGLSIVGMFWTPNIKKEQLVKLTIGLTSLVSMTVLLEMLSDAIPKTSVFPLLGIYVVCCVGITSLASVVITLHCLPNPRKDYETREIERALEKKKCGISRPLTPRTILGMFHRNTFFLLFFQVLNLAGFIVFLSFWD